jgi:DNA-directed RNA polymerase specialized sigma24 family protein
MAESGDDSPAADSLPPTATVGPRSFDLLLERLAGGGVGALGYERLRIRLIAFFRLRFPAQAEALADEAFDRLARRLADGTAVESPEGYALGIARLLLLEAQNRQNKERRIADEVLRDFELGRWDAAEPDPAAPALRACLEGLGREGEGFILDYYQADGGTDRVTRRQQLAQRLGVTLNALRNRALRMRLALENCVRARLHQEHSGSSRGRDGKPKSDTSRKMRGDTT